MKNGNGIRKINHEQKSKTYDRWASEINSILERLASDPRGAKRLAEQVATTVVYQIAFDDGATLGDITRAIAECFPGVDPEEVLGAVDERFIEVPIDFSEFEREDLIELESDFSKQETRKIDE